MSKWKVNIGSDAFEVIEIEADSEEEAKEIALRKSTLDVPIVEWVEQL